MLIQECAVGMRGHTMWVGGFDLPTNLIHALSAGRQLAGPTHTSSIVVPILLVTYSGKEDLQNHLDVIDRAVSNNYYDNTLSCPLVHETTTSSRGVMSERLAVRAAEEAMSTAMATSSRHAGQQCVRPPRRPPVLAEQHHAPERADERQRLHGVGGRVPRHLPGHVSMLPIPFTIPASQRPAPLYVAEVGLQLGGRHVGHRVVKEVDVQGQAEEEAGQREIKCF